MIDLAPHLAWMGKLSRHFAIRYQLPDAGEEILHDAIVNAMATPSYNPAFGNDRGWLYRVVQNAARVQLNFAKRGSVFGISLDDEAGERAAAAALVRQPYEDPNAGVMDIRKALAELMHPYQLHALHGHLFGGPRTIAHATHLYNARLALRVSLGMPPSRRAKMLLESKLRQHLTPPP